MLLTIDVGNTNIVLGGYKGDELMFVSRISSRRHKLQDEYAIELISLLAFYGYKKEDFSNAIISSVVPPLLPTLKRAIESLNIKVIAVTKGIKTGINIKIDDPGVLGSDLVCGGVGAIKKYPLPCVVVDLGTATKFSAIDKDACFLGCAILPGVNISLEALSANTAQLPKIDFEGVKKVIGTNSSDSMRAGIIFGTASMIDGMLEKFSQEIGGEVTAVATGGIAKYIVPYCNKNVILDEDLILLGLKEIFRKNER